MKLRVTFARPPRTYSDNPCKPYTDGLGSTAEAANIEDKKLVGKGRVNYPSIEGVIINPLPDRPKKQEQEKEGGVDAVLAMALALGAEDRKTLLAKLSLDQQAQKPGDRELEMWSRGVQTALVAAIGGEAGSSYGVMVLRRVLGPAVAWQPVADFMARAGFAGLDVSRRQGVYMLLADLLVKYAHAVARKVQAPLTPKFVANNAQHIAAVFDNAFPGYVAAGLALLVASRHTGPR